MMDLNDKKGKDNNLPLKTEEIINILNNSNRSDFAKSEKLFDSISSNFKKYEMADFAKKEASPQVSKNKSEIDDSNNQESDIVKNNSELSEKNGLKGALEDKIEEIKEEKKITETEAKRIANEQSEIRYTQGKNDGIKMIKDQLQKGEEAIALDLKNTIDNIFFTSPKLLESLNKSIKESILNICSNLVGYEIDNLPDNFIKKIESLVESISNSTNKAKISLSKNDYMTVTSFLKKNQPNAEIDFLIDESLNRGDMIIKSGGIEIKDIIIEKINIPKNSELSEDLSKLDEKNKSDTNISLDEQENTKTLNVQNNSMTKDKVLNKISEKDESHNDSNIETKTNQKST